MGLFLMTHPVLPTHFLNTTGYMAGFVGTGAQNHFLDYTHLAVPDDKHPGSNPYYQNDLADHHPGSEILFDTSE